ncbi:MAG: non-canonical purine NTP pyrophosphatase [Candidatus Ryanbacteria bacterium]|nr:non-canonical purine NTP pyrophosphatase [Candidatus Ryanbacteria bacterium]
MNKVIFATGNKAKLAQIRFVVGHFKFPVEIIGVKDFYTNYTSYEEIGDTIEQVSLNGALAVAKMIGSPVITEDTDFRVDALNGGPGIRAGEFLKNFGRAEILKRMSDIENRRAVISSAVVYATPEGMSKVFLNSVEGKIADKERSGDFPDWVAPTSENSFGGGYNAIFLPNGWDKTLAEISPIEAIPWSYREQNFTNVLKYILSLD